MPQGITSIEMANQRTNLHYLTESSLMSASGSLRSAKVILQTHNVIFAKITAALNFNEDE